jgi:type I restriction enzyme S subunit
LNSLSVRFGDLYAEPSRNGLSRPKRVRGTGYRMVNMGELFAHDFLSNQEMELVPMSSAEIAKFRLEPGDLLFARQSLVLEGTGKCSIFLGHPDTTTFESHLIRVRLTAEQACPHFFYYFFRSPQGRGTIQSIAMQVAASGIRASELAELRVPAPPLPTQRKIAAILSAYDDLIENNNRRIKLLEEMAQRIYREWFVEFRYPGYRDVPLADSEMGPIPEGWSVAPLADQANVLRGRSYRGADVVAHGGIPFVNLKCVARDGGFRRDGIKRYAGDYREVHTVRSGDIIMAVTDMTQERRIVARAARVPEIGAEFGVFSMDLVKIVPVGLPREYMLAMLRYSDFPDVVKAHANGANVLHLHPNRILDYRMVFPTRPLADRYRDHVAPMQHLSDNLDAECDRLRSSRDLLLPRLVSGEIDAMELDIDVTDLAA